MSLHINFDGVSDSGIQARIETAIRDCIGNPPRGEDWSVTVTSFGSGCTVVVKTPNQTRKKVFLLRASELPEAIPPWLRQYPLR